MAILRHAPGERVPIAGTYVLVGHYGEDTGSPPQWFDKGAQLPFLAASSEFGQVWFVRLAESAVAARAA